jgi:hypothetical protein
MLVVEGVAGRRQACVWVCAQWPSEQEDERLRFVNFVMNPPSRLLHSKSSPLVLSEQARPWSLLVNMLGQENVSIFEVLILVFLRILDLVWEVRHMCLKFEV